MGGEHVAAEADVDGAGVASEPRRYSHTDSVDDLAGITLAAGAGGVPSSTATATGANAPSASSYYVHTDHLGSVRAVTDDAGSVVNEYSYDSYGQPERTVETVPQPFRFTGREYDQETGLSHYRSRAYDPSTGRFLQEDPIWFEAGDLNVYRYVWNSPANWTDPSGMAAAGQYASTLAVPVALVGGTIATQRMLSTASGSARYLASADKNALSTIGAAIACTFYTLADA
ncbi:RHS repeat-associated core domain-containing protein [Agrobacterium pusense]|uniref:RHS repeat-associated core domain-containing protein n=1 Tax=Agrobacterium pusense TaxID=648995 RepID=UPI003FCFD60F